MSISAFGDKVPQFGSGVFVRPAATIIGGVVLAAGITVWPGADLSASTRRGTSRAAGPGRRAAARLTRSLAG